MAKKSVQEQEKQPAPLSPEYLSPGDVAYVISCDYSILRGSVTIESITSHEIIFTGPVPAFTESSDMILNVNDYTRWANTHACEDTTIRCTVPKSMQGFRKIGR